MATDLTYLFMKNDFIASIMSYDLGDFRATPVSELLLMYERL